MVLKINSMYKVDGGFIIPRSHFSEDAAPNYAIFELLQGGESHFVKKHTTFNRKELRKVLGLGKDEKVELI